MDFHDPVVDILTIKRGHPFLFLIGLFYFVTETLPASSAIINSLHEIRTLLI